MNDKLKTLKDLQEIWLDRKDAVMSYPAEKHHLYMRTNHAQEIKQEAIKWYHHEADKEYHTEPTTAIEFILEFFNITENDLK